LSYSCPPLNRIWAESEAEGKGAAFIVELPLAKNLTEEQLKMRAFKKRWVFS
jgi:hypothetical protein